MASQKERGGNTTGVLVTRYVMMAVAAGALTVFGVCGVTAQNSSSKSGNKSNQGNYGAFTGSGPFDRQRNTSSNNKNANQRTDQDVKREKQKREKERNRRSRSSKATPKSSGKKKMTTTKGKPAAKKKSSTGGTGRAATTVEFKIKADPSTNILLVEGAGQTPTLNIAATLGEKLVTRVVYRNGRRSQFDSIDVSLKYDPAVLEPIGIDDSGLEGLLAEPAIARMEPRRGVIAYHAQFAKSENREIMELFRLEWKAVGIVADSPLVFVNTSDFPSRVLDGETNVLHSRSSKSSEIELSESTGLLGASVFVVPDEETAKAMPVNDEFYGGMNLARNISEGAAEGGVLLGLRSNDTVVTVNREFLVDIVYSNPKRAEIDSVNLRIRFDPKTLQVVDYDSGNWISKDVNVFDGDYHEDLPFDHHIKNIAYNSSGRIAYQMGFGTRVRVPANGVIATIRFRAIGPAPVTEVAFDLTEDERNQKTSISFLGFNLIGTPGERTASVRNLAVSIQ